MREQFKRLNFSEILLFHLHAVPSRGTAPNQPTIFMQAHTPCHNAKRVNQFLGAKSIKIIV